MRLVRKAPTDSGRVSFLGSVAMSPTVMQVTRHDVVESGPIVFAVSSGPCQVLDGLIPREATSNSDSPV